VHGTTGQQPCILFEEDERRTLQPYLIPESVRQDGQRVTRKADKTGLISWKANKYSVPMAYQRKQVGVTEDAGSLKLYDLTSNE
jgi:hypothetical protein